MSLSPRLRLDETKGWWYEGGGIYRPVKLIIADGTTHVDDYGIFVPSQVVGAVNRSTWPPTAAANVTIHTSLRVNETALQSGDHSVEISNEIYDPDGKRVWAGSIAPGWQPSSGLDRRDFTQHVSLPEVKLWEPKPTSVETNQDEAEESAVYKVVTIVSRDLKPVDMVTTTFGVRKAEFSPDDGFTLNDLNVKVKGMCNHQDFAGIGVALPPRMQDFRVATLQEFGVNAWRMSHNPPNKALLDVTDRRGMLVWDENRMFGNFSTWYADQENLIKVGGGRTGGGGRGGMLKGHRGGPLLLATA